MICLHFDSSHTPDKELTTKNYTFVQKIFLQFDSILLQSAPECQTAKDIQNMAQPYYILPVKETDIPLQSSP